jgi:CHASE2 domain-containing sensor protein
LQVFAAVAVLVVAQALAMDLLGRYDYLPEGSGHWTDDWLIRYFSKREDGPDPRVALVFVDDETLEKEKLPPGIPDRGYVAKLISAVAAAQPVAIGLDFYYASAIDPAKDANLANTIKSLNVPLVMAAVDGTLLATDNQRKFLKEFIAGTGRPAGHIYLKQTSDALTLGDRAVRLIDHGPSRDGYPSLSSQIARLPAVVKAFGPHAIPTGPQRIDWLLPPRQGNTFTRIPAWKIAGSPDDAATGELRNKIVFIGPDFRQTDRHFVPFSVGSQTQFPGTFVQAQILAQILDERFFHEWDAVEQFLLLLVICATGATAGFYLHGTRVALALGIIGTAAIIALSVPFFLVQAPLPIALLILSWAGGISIGERSHAWNRG